MTIPPLVETGDQLIPAVTDWCVCRGPFLVENGICSECGLPVAGEPEPTPKRGLPKWALVAIGHVVFFCWVRPKNGLQKWLRRALGIESDVEIIAKHLDHVQKLFMAMREDFETHEQSNKEQFFDVGKVGKRLSYYEEHVGTLNYVFLQLRRRAPKLFE